MHVCLKTDPVKEGLLLTPLYTRENRGRETSINLPENAWQVSGQEPDTQAIWLPSHRSNHFPTPHRNRNLPGERWGRGVGEGEGEQSWTQGWALWPRAFPHGQSQQDRVEISLQATLNLFAGGFSSFPCHHLSIRDPSPGEEKYSMMSFVVPSPWRVLITCLMNHSINKMSPQVEMLVLACSPRERKEVPPGAFLSTSGR